jgi:hypothetical protein
MPVNGLGPCKIITPVNTPRNNPKMTFLVQTATAKVIKTGMIEIIPRFSMQYVPMY